VMMEALPRRICDQEKRSILWELMGALQRPVELNGVSQRGRESVPPNIDI
jgi:hypothetical protein